MFVTSIVVNLWALCFALRSTWWFEEEQWYNEDIMAISWRYTWDIMGIWLGISWQIMAAVATEWHSQRSEQGRKDQPVGVTTTTIYGGIPSFKTFLGNCLLLGLPQSVPFITSVYGILPDFDNYHAPQAFNTIGQNYVGYWVIVSCDIILSHTKIKYLILPH